MNSFQFAGDVILQRGPHNLKLGAEAHRYRWDVFTSANQGAAIQLAIDRVEQVRADPRYDALDTAYTATETTFPTLSGFTRVTSIVRTGGLGQPNDYKKVTVRVTGPGVSPAVVRTVTVAAP